MRHNAFLVFAVLLFASNPAIADPTPKALAVFLLTPEITASPDEVVCVSIDGRDASADVLSELRVAGKQLLPRSECGGDIAGSYEKKARRSASLVSVSAFRATSDARGEVVLSLYRNGKWGIEKTLEVERDGATWRIVAVKRQVEA